MDRRIISVFIENGADLMASGPCKQVADVTEVLDWAAAIRQVRSNKEDEGVGLCAGAYMGGIRPAIMIQMHSIWRGREPFGNIDPVLQNPIANADQLSRLSGRSCGLSGRNGPAKTSYLYQRPDQRP